MLSNVVLEKILESLLDSKEIKPVSPKGNWPSVFIGRTDAEAPTLRPPDTTSWFIEKGLDAWKDLRQKEKVISEDEMIRKHHWINRYESESVLRDSGGQGVLECCRSWCRKESDMTKLLNNKNKVWDYATDIMPSHSSQIQKIQPGSHVIMYFPLYICI